MTDDWNCIPCATPWAKQFQDDINSLKEFERREEGDDFVRELTGDLRKSFRLYADDVCAIDVSGIRAKYWSARWPRLGDANA